MEMTLTRSEVARTETVRLETLEKYELRGAMPDPAVDDLVELAARVCNTPIAGISFAFADRIVLHSRYGIAEFELAPGTLPDAPGPKNQPVLEISDSRH